VPILKQHFPSEFDGDGVEDIINSGFFAHEVRDRDFFFNSLLIFHFLRHDESSE
jgi:hypothetical protein